MGGVGPWHAHWLRPDWPADARVGGLMTTRAGGVSQGPYASFNLGRSVGDDPQAVQANRARLAEAIAARPVFLSQVHGNRVLNLDRQPVDAQEQADASITTRAGVACTVMVADCLPVLFAAPEGRGVGSAHAGWRGLAGGVLDNTVLALCEAAACAPRDLVAWLGACIGPQAFEVGADVLQAFAEPSDPGNRRFAAKAPAADGTPRWWADLPGLARDRLAAAGVNRVHGGGWCTVGDASRFFSYRRDRVTGRMAAAVWLRG
jgi:YfiH family protein